MMLRRIIRVCLGASALGVAALGVTIVLAWGSLREQQQSLLHIYAIQQRMATLSQGINHLLLQDQPAWSARVLVAEARQLASAMGLINYRDADAASQFLLELEGNIAAIAELAQQKLSATEQASVRHAQGILVNQVRAHEAGLNVAAQAVLGNHYSGVEQAVYRVILTLFAMALALAALSLAGFALLFRRIDQPLNALNEGISALQQGRRDQPIVVSARDEFGDLAEGFNHMLGSLRNHEETVQQQQRSLALALAQQQAILDTLPANIALLDSDGKVLDTNSGWQAFARDNDYREADQGRERNYLAVCDTATGADAEIAAEVAKGLRGILSGESGANSFTLTYPCHSPDEQRWFRLMATPLVDGGQHRGAVVMHIDVTERELAELALERTAYEDPVTGLPSRAGFGKQLQDTPLPASPGEAFYILLCDVRKLNDINQNCGYLAGDHLLRALGQRLAENLVSGERIGSMSSGQFVLLIDHRQRGLTTPGEIWAWLDTLIDLPFFVDQHTLYIDLTLGLTLCDSSARGHEELLRHGQLALQTARERGERWVAFDPALEKRVQDRIWTTVGLRNALAERHFELHYQPKVNLADGQVTSAEALLRWRHPILGLRPPDSFIPVAESSQLIVPIGEWVLREACESLSFWQKQGLHAARIAVNVSMVQFMQSDVPAMVSRILDDVGIDPSALSLEITESVFEQESEHLLRQMEALQALGVRLSLDDFGTGFSSLSHLRRYPFDEIKIDRSFIRDCTENSHSRGIVEVIMGLAANLGCSVVAEGVETVAQRDLLLQLGCTIGQGYFYSMPLTGEDFYWLLSSSSHLPLNEQAKITEVKI
ncbi:EAL domain-containing protein [Haliea sp. E1-2-M8]|uniref:EAL domain-containing protein n=1 Tax=Haliea sp. E1-2-M8 TaxID=3064706 RepID=UPI0027171B4F|nr:EAL domain-containing protein [Haliea sp. E1-2-M8]MDO8860350.1 EAL domain-containing protein [Haliea sp. E1-2-M8]